MREKRKPNQELIELIAGAVQTIAESKGYLTYPKEAEIGLVLQALYLVNVAIKTQEEQNARRGRKDQNTR